MKGGKDEEKKHLDPLFPRIHINDAEKGGPRAPPRNKMALCEQLTMPSNRFTSASMSMLPLSPSTSTSTSTGLAPSASLSHIGCHKKSMFSPFCSSPGSSDIAVRPHPHGSGGVNLNSALINPELQSLKPKSYPTLSATGHLPMATESNLFQPRSFPSARNSTAEKIREQEYLGVTSFSHLGRSLTRVNTRENMDNYKHALSCSNSSGKLQTASETQLKEKRGIDLKSIEYMGKQAEGNCKVSQSSEQYAKRLDSVLSTKVKIVADTALCPVARDKNAEPDTGRHVVKYISKQAEVICKVSQTGENHTKRPPVLSTEEKIFTDAASTLMPRDRDAELDSSAVVSTCQKRSSLLDDLSRLCDPCAQSHQDYKTLQESNATRDGIVRKVETFTRKRSASTMERQLCSIQRIGDKHRSPSRPASVNECSKDQDGSERIGVVDRSDGTSETSVVDSIAGFVVSPDDVVGVIGQKQFWKARRTIVHQQRIFAVQIFELHRLIKVQRMIAESPEMIFEDSFYVGKSSVKFSPMKKLIAENIREPSSLSLQAKANPQKPNLSIEGQTENACGKPPPLDNDTQKGLNTKRSTPKPCSLALTSPPTATDVKFAPLFIQPPPGNQWLIPVRSPSEGLIYKPYSGPCPPTAGFLTPVYGSCGPVSLTGGGANFLNTAYCVPASNQQGIGNFPDHTTPGQIYFPPYPMPVINASGSNSTVERISTFSKHRPTEQDINVPTSEPVIPYQSSCNIPSQKSWIASDCGKQHLHDSKGSDLQGSTASSPPERNKGDALSLFPTTPSIHVCHQPVCSPGSEQQRIQVIKVVPHSRKSASESAARIFRTIQEERKQHE